MASKLEKRVKKEAKKFARRHTGFVISLILCLVAGIALGFGLCYGFSAKDEFTLYNDGVAMSEATVYLQSGETYDINANENKTKVVVFGKDVSSYVKYTIKYINLETEEVEIVTDFTKDGTYCIIYELDYSGDFLTEFLAKKYEKVKLRKTVIIGGNE
jgi:hypothetical protein